MLCSVCRELARHPSEPAWPLKWLPHWQPRGLLSTPLHPTATWRKWTKASCGGDGWGNVHKEALFCDFPPRPSVPLQWDGGGAAVTFSWAHKHFPLHSFLLPCESEKFLFVSPARDRSVLMCRRKSVELPTITNFSPWTSCPKGFR